MSSLVQVIVSCLVRDNILIIYFLGLDGVFALKQLSFNVTIIAFREQLSFNVTIIAFHEHAPGDLDGLWSQ